MFPSDFRGRVVGLNPMISCGSAGVPASIHIAQFHNLSHVTSFFLLTSMLCLMCASVKFTVILWARTHDAYFSATMYDTVSHPAADEDAAAPLKS